MIKKCLPYLGYLNRKLYSLTFNLELCGIHEYSVPSWVQPLTLSHTEVHFLP